MDQSVGDNQFERQHCPLNSTVSTAFQSLDTVRALHQTVVSLRTALEDAHKEIDNLKKQILIQTDIDDGKLFRLIHEPANIDNSNSEEQVVQQINQQQNSVENIITELSESLDQHQQKLLVEQQENQKQEKIHIRPTIETEQISINSVQLPTETERIITSSKKTAQNSNKNLKIKSSTCKFTYDLTNEKSSQLKNAKYSETINEPTTNSPRLRTNTFTLSSGAGGSEKKRKQMASKIDVKIKVSSNIKVNESGSSTTTDTGSSDNTKDATDQSQSDEQGSASDSAEHEDHEESYQQPEKDNKHETVDIDMTSQENINITKKEITMKKSSTDNINIDNLSVSSLSEGDNSVFGDDDAGENQTDHKANPKLVATQSTSSELHGEEVDDIELIFSSDDKEFPQEDLVSISEYEPWGKAGTSGTPVLVNFSTILSSGEEQQDDIESKQMEMGQDGNENVNEQRRFNRRQQAGDGNIDSCDNLYTDYNNSHPEDHDDEQNNDNNSSRRDENFDTFDPIGNTNTTMGRRWTNYNVLIETDISKCGIAEENILEMGRRNTCPNPPAYRPILHREALGQQQQSRHCSMRCPLTSKFPRINRTQQYPSSRSTRPILSESNRPGPKRSSSAQTEISALPEHWRSESHLAGGRYGVGMCTLPSKFVPSPGMACHRYPLRYFF